MSGKLSKIYICRKKGGIEEVVSQANLDKEHGLLGDYKSESGDKDRQLSILLSKDRHNIDKNYKDIGLCTRRFQENLLIEGFDLSELSLYTKLKIGESKIEIRSMGKRCYSECELVKNKKICPLKNRSLFARIIESGTIKLGDKVVKEDIK